MIQKRIMIIKYLTKIMKISKITERKKKNKNPRISGNRSFGGFYISDYQIKELSWHDCCAYR